MDLHTAEVLRLGISRAPTVYRARLVLTPPATPGFCGLDFLSAHPPLLRVQHSYFLFLCFFFFFMGVGREVSWRPCLPLVETSSPSGILRIWSLVVERRVL